MPPVKSLEVADVLQTSIQAYARNFTSFAKLGFALAVPLQLAFFGVDLARQWFARSVGTLPPEAWMKRLLLAAPMTLSVIFVTMLIYGFAQALFCVAAIESAAGRKVDSARTMRFAMSQILSVLLVALLVNLASSVGLLFLLLPGIVIWLLTAVAMPCAVTENIGAIDSLQRSITLTEGSRTTIFLCLFVFSASAAAAGMIGNIPQNSLIGRDIAAANLWAPGLLGARVLSTAVAAILLPLHGIISGVLYARLREIRERATLESIAAVFAP